MQLRKFTLKPAKDVGTNYDALLAGMDQIEEILDRQAGNTAP